MMVMAGRGSAICCNPGNVQSFHLTSFSHPIRVQWVVERRRQSQPRWDWKSRNSLHDKAAEREGVAPISSEWRSVGLGSAAGTRAAGGSGGVRLILALQGPGGGRQGEMVSSGGNRRAGGVFRVSEDHKHDATWADLAEAEEVAPPWPRRMRARRAAACSPSPARWSSSWRG